MARYEGPANPLFMRADLTRDTIGEKFNNNPMNSVKDITGAINQAGSGVSLSVAGNSATFLGPVQSALAVPNQQSIPTTGKPLPGIPGIGPDEGRSTRDESNDQPVVRHIVHKPWLGTPGLAPMEGDKTPFLGHDLQLMPGNLVFTAVPLYAPPKHEEHKVIAGDLAKVNSVLAKQYTHIETQLRTPGWIFGAPNRGVRSVQGLSYRDTLNFIYKRVVTANMTHLGVRVSQDLDAMVTSYLNQLSFVNLVEDASLIIENPMNMDDIPDSSTDDSESDDTPLLTRDKRVKSLANRYAAWPSETDVYQAHKKFFRDRERIMNPLHQFNVDTNDKEVLEGERADSIQQIDAECKEALENADFSNYFANLTEYESTCLRCLFRIALSEILGSLDTYTSFCTAAGVTDMWKFWGVHYNSGTGNRPGGDLGPMSHIGNYIMEKNARILNRWDSELKPNTRLYVYLSKVGDKRHSPYQFIPWNSHPFTDVKNSVNTDYPPPRILSFHDRNGNGMNAGHPIFIGTVRYKYQDFMDSEKRRIMNGICDPLNGSYYVSYPQAHENLMSLTNNWLEIFVRC